MLRSTAARTCAEPATPVIAAIILVSLSGQQIYGPDPSQLPRIPHLSDGRSIHQGQLIRFYCPFTVKPDQLPIAIDSPTPCSVVRAGMEMLAQHRPHLIVAIISLLISMKMMRNAVRPPADPINGAWPVNGQRANWPTSHGYIGQNTSTYVDTSRKWLAMEDTYV